MAPRKRTSEQVEPAMSAPVTKRVTRSSARLAAEANSVVDSAPVLPKKKEPKGKKAKVVVKKLNSEETESENVKEKKDGSENGGDAKKGKTIVIEHCKQCSSFKRTALKLEDGLEKGVSGIKVLLNPDKPRRGCFEVREEGGEIFVSLLGMKRPFQPMKDLDLDEVVASIVGKIK